MSHRMQHTSSRIGVSRGKNVDLLVELIKHALQSQSAANETDPTRCDTKHPHLTLLRHHNVWKH